MQGANEPNVGPDPAQRLEASVMFAHGILSLSSLTVALEKQNEMHDVHRERIFIKIFGEEYRVAILEFFRLVENPDMEQTVWAEISQLMPQVGDYTDILYEVSEEDPEERGQRLLGFVSDSGQEESNVVGFLTNDAMWLRLYEAWSKFHSLAEKIVNYAGSNMFVKAAQELALHDSYAFWIMFWEYVFKLRPLEEEVYVLKTILPDVQRTMHAPQKAAWLNTGKNYITARLKRLEQSNPKLLESILLCQHAETALILTGNEPLLKLA
jgi:hypothetical protein